MSFFGGNPFATHVGQLIEQATDSTLSSENWQLNMEICDAINSSNDVPKDAVKAIKKRLTIAMNKRNYVIIMYTLTVLETCVKNCCNQFHILIASKDFLQEFMKVISPKNDPPEVVQEKVLSLIQTWADAFKHRPEMKEINKIYTELKAKGIEFPMTDIDNMVPIITPARTHSESSPPPAAVQPTTGVTQGGYPAYTTNQPQQPMQYPPQSAGQPAVMASVKLQPEQMLKLRKELDITQQNCKVFSEMLTEMNPGGEQSSDLDLLHELNGTCRQMQQRIMQLLESVSNEDVTEELLRINDYLNNVFIRYDRFVRNNQTQISTSDSTTPITTNNADTLPIRSPAAEPTTPNLIDLDTPSAGTDVIQDPFSIPVDNSSDLQNRLANMSLGTTSVSATLDGLDNAAASRASAAPSIGDEEFDMFAQSRQSFDHGKQPTQPGTAAGVYQNQQVDLFSGGLNTAVQAKVDENGEQPSGKNSDYDEMSKWLDGENGAAKPQESATSSEFDQFLADRVKEAENLPDVPRANRQLQKDDKDNAMFAL